MTYIVSRDVTTDECPWLPVAIVKGTLVYRCVKATYGACTPTGEAVTFDPTGDYPFFELPQDSLMGDPDAATVS